MLVSHEMLINLSIRHPGVLLQCMHHRMPQHVYVPGQVQFIVPRLLEGRVVHVVI